MSPLIQAVLKTGLVTPEMLREMKRFSGVIDPEATADSPIDLEVAAKIIEEALQSDRYILLRETDLNAIQQYTATAKPGVLHLEINDAQKSEFDVTYGRTAIGEYIIAWRSESIREMVANGLTYLDTDEEHIFFKDVRELFYGEQKSFMICVPSEKVLDKA